MRVDGIFIGIEVSDEVTGDAALAAKLDEVCPVDIFKAGDRVSIGQENVDECVLCRLCMDAAPDGEGGFSGGGRVLEIAETMEFPLVPVLADMEMAGVKIDERVLADHDPLDLEHGAFEELSVPRRGAGGRVARRSVHRLRRLGH